MSESVKTNKQKLIINWGRKIEDVVKSLNFLDKNWTIKFSYPKEKEEEF